MTYRITCLTPLLVGDGNRLSPIDYMVWKDQVNILDQKRIFTLLSRGPRLEGYLSQLKRAEKLDFASWGGFAQNFAGRRIPFEHPSSTAHWERARAEHLFIPTFAANQRGAYLPGSALKGALRTGLLLSRAGTDGLRDVAEAMRGDRPPRRPAEKLEDLSIGTAGLSRMKLFGIADSAPIPQTPFRVYLTRVATLVARGGGRFELGWKAAGRGTVDGRKPEDSTATFVEMAPPGTVFAGDWFEKDFYGSPDLLRAMRWKERPDRAALFNAANDYAAAQLEQHAKYAEGAALSGIAQTVAQLKARLDQVRGSDRSCLIALGWGAGLLSKSSFAGTGDEVYRNIMRQVPLYSKAIQTGLPFPKTRRLVFQGGQPAALPGWAVLELNG
jgi:CRISPR-associated protein Csm5